MANKRERKEADLDPAGVWAQQVLDLVRQAESLPAALEALANARMPGTDVEKAAALATLWAALAGASRPLSHATVDLAVMHFAQLTDRLVREFRGLLSQVLRDRLRLAQAGHGDLLLREHFRERGVLHGTAIACGHRLDAEHPAADLLAPEEMFQISGVRYFVLGSPDADGWPLQQVAEMTRSWRAAQVEEERQRRAEMERKREVELRIAEGMRDPLERRVDELEAEVAELRARQAEALAESAEVVAG